MKIVVICIIVTVSLFMAAFVTKRRFGLLGLALAAGSILGGIWKCKADLIANYFGFPSGVATSSIVIAAIVLLPAIIVLLHGYNYKTLIGRVVGASLFTLLALAFLVEPLNNVLALNGVGLDVYNWLNNNHTMIISSGLILAIVDLFLAKPTKVFDKKHTH
jgi:hypothetical protein